MIHHINQQIALLIRHNFNLVPALLLSAGTHYGLVNYWPQPTQNKLIPSEAASPLKVVLLRQSNTINHLSSKEANSAEGKFESKNIKKNLNKAPSSAQSMQKNITQTDTYTEYLSPNDVEIQALPIVNIDLSMLSGNVDPAHLQQSLPIQLRLYIDEFGKVVRVERIGMVLAQDEGIANALEDSLQKLTFTPAKRASLEVKSYQEVAFDFKENF